MMCKKYHNIITSKHKLITTMATTTIYNVASTSAARCELTCACLPEQQKQILVKIDNAKTYVLNFSNQSKITHHDIIRKLSQVTNFPTWMLRIHNVSHEDGQGHEYEYEHALKKLNYLSAYTFLPLLGGKGGFGTLLKGQSKQAGAKQTMDFGACRDLNGRRLRHVNDEIKLQRWRESVQRRAKANNNGMIDVEKEMEELKTSSGVLNWHLTVPSWGAGEMSGKSRYREERKMRREIEKLAREQKEVLEKKLRRKREIEKVKIDYATLGKQSAEIEDAKLSRSILEGLKKRRKINHVVGKISDNDDNDSKGSDSYFTNGDDKDPIPVISTSDDFESFLYTLSGDIVVEESQSENTSSLLKNHMQDKDSAEIKVTKIQSKSEFGTMALLLDPERIDLSSKSYKGLYYELVIDTAGIAQIGWGQVRTSDQCPDLNTMTTTCFKPDSASGDGVGDDEFSFGYDGCRRKIFHGGEELSYGSKTGAAWKKGDIIGCLYDITNGTISFSTNGVNPGTAFKSKLGKDCHLYPVISLNENEIVGINTGPSFCHCPKDFRGIFDFLNEKNEKRSDYLDSNNKNDSCEVSDKMDNAMDVSPSPTMTKASDIKPVTKPEEIKPDKTEPIDLQNLSLEQIEALGMDHLKAELFRIGLKCGGSLKERAKRLYSTKGLTRDQIPKKLRGKQF